MESAKKEDDSSLHYLSVFFGQGLSWDFRGFHDLKRVGVDTNCKFEYPMARAPYILDGHGFATKVKNAKGQKWRSDASIACPKCTYTINNAHAVQEWPGLPAGVKFDPSDQELLGHLAEKVGIGNAKPHPFIDEFILTLKEDNGICYTHPENLPGVKQDGGSLHIFHKTSKAYTTGHRKCRKITSDVPSAGEVRWHKTGKTKPVIENGKQKGCKKIMVLYTSAKGSKAGKTNWVMHQYHLGTEEDEKEGEFVVSKVFYQQQTKQCEKSDPDVPTEDIVTIVSKGGPVTPKTSTPALPPRTGKAQVLLPCLDVIKEEQLPCAVSPQAAYLDATVRSHFKGNDADYDTQNYVSNATLDYSFWSAGESQFLEDSQELNSLFCGEMPRNQACQDTVQADISMPNLSECGHIGGNESESRQGSVEVGNSMASLSECGPIANHEPEKECSSGNHEIQKEPIGSNEPEKVHVGNNEPEKGHVGNDEPEKDLDKYVDPVLAKIYFDTPPDGTIT
ncbi:hypothetical protein KI387_028185, partial [Taxus chinensis]